MTKKTFAAQDSVGIVSPQTYHCDTALTLVSGKLLAEFNLVYETYGTLNPEKNNAILICHALSGHHHAAGFHRENEERPGWWDWYIGPGKPIDTSRFFVVCLNNIGGCHGSSGPVSTNPETGELYGPDFPVVTVKDWVQTQFMLMQHLKIDCWAAVIGGSLGGMQALQWSMSYPDCLKHAVIIASAPKLTAQNIAFNEVARRAILADPHFNQGHYLKHETFPKQGLMLARMVGHITYLSDDAMGEKFGRDLKHTKLQFGFDVEFQVESYLRHQGKSFSHRFDANTYLLMTRALDYFDPAAEYDNSLVKALEQTQCKFVLMAFSTDWRFSPERSRELVNALVTAKKPVSYAEIDSPYGHDAFLLPNPRYEQALKAAIDSIYRQAVDSQPARQTTP